MVSIFLDLIYFVKMESFNFWVGFVLKEFKTIQKKEASTPLSTKDFEI